MLFELIMGNLRKEVEAWRREAAESYSITRVNAIADTIDDRAKKLEAKIAELEQLLDTVTPEQFAELHDVTPQTVRNWIRWGWLVAEETASGWKIPRTAKVVRQKRSA